MSAGRILGRLRGLVEASHPYPLSIVMALTALVGFVSAGGEPDGGRLVLMLGGMLGAQLAIGWTNDYLDQRRDRVYQPSKPVAEGSIDARVLLPASVVAIGGGIACAAALGPAPLVLLLAGLAAGLAYNAGVKDTRLSWLPYAIAFAVLPAYVWRSLDVFEADFGWLYLVGAPLAVAAHIANTLPDLDGDAAAGARGIVVTLGRRRALVVLAALLLAPVGLVALTLPFVAYDAVVLAATGVVYAAVLASAGVSYSREPWEDAAEWGFRVVLMAEVAFVTGWLASVA